MRNVIIGIALVLLVLSAIFCYKTYRADKLLEEQIFYLKKQLIEASNVEKIDSTLYLKVINDLNTEKEINNKLRESNEELYAESQKYKVLYYTSIEISGESKTDTVSLDITNSENEIKEIKFVDHYPDSVNPFIQYTGTLNKKNVIGTFDIYPVKIEHTIVEDSYGVKRIIFNTPSWVRVEDITVDALYGYQQNAKAPVSLYIKAGVLHMKETRAYGEVLIGRDNFYYGVMGGKNLVGASIMYKLF